ncbi:hypothetical protein [Gimibacter soli]|uniref:Uracil-DNA glycosylase-like domain-containing protein n=1 Tax=Gimibacter soli TaxID=3024400 RepID=A0AAE9XND4_9PROT|nr:hypothetical protein [Gimibacter soli]WCL53227.1 hypothetical protein PH603_11845 [Gimibacter soli]
MDIGKVDLQVKAREKLKDIQHRTGGILYSGHSTLVKGDIYILGFNPGGAPEDGRPISESIDTMLTNDCNAYLCENWLTSDQGPDAPYSRAPLQQRLKWIADQLGYPLQTICASNLIFVKSRRAGEVPRDLADICWPVHEAILGIVRPKLILAFGNSKTSPFNYLQTPFDCREAVVDHQAAGHGNWKLKRFRAVVKGSPLVVAGLPHLSRYSPCGKEYVADWLRESLEGSFETKAG